MGIWCATGIWGVGKQCGRVVGQVGVIPYWVACGQHGMSQAVAVVSFGKGIPLGSAQAI